MTERHGGGDTRLAGQDLSAVLGVHETEIEEVAGQAGAFDLVYTGIGALCWLPDIRRWAEVVASLLRPGGRLFVREGLRQSPAFAAVLPEEQEKIADAMLIGVHPAEAVRRRDGLLADLAGHGVVTAR